ncbi:hypothetical protein V8V91_14670 [Algoriphagus halophilus]|uniref:hypothetical protein n=1 Tax=Algoriphagus halophilus TaxID=226505 RepID=UPI00358F7BD5
MPAKAKVPSQAATGHHMAETGHPLQRITHSSGLKRRSTITCIWSSGAYNTPSEAYFKFTVYALRFAYRIEGMKDKRIELPAIKRSKRLPIVLSREEVLPDFLKLPNF